MDIESKLVAAKYRTLLRLILGIASWGCVIGALCLLVSQRSFTNGWMIMILILALLSSVTMSENLRRYLGLVGAHRVWKASDPEDKRTMEHSVSEIEKLSPKLITPGLLVELMSAYKDMRDTELYRGAHMDHTSLK